MEPSPSNPRRYHNFILSIWQAQSSRAGAAWHFRLENPHTGERNGFKQLHDLIMYLQRWTEQPPPSEEPDSPVF